MKTWPFDREISSDPTDLLNAVLKLVDEFGLVSKTTLFAFEWQLLISANEACPGIGRDFLTINPDFVRRLYKRKDAVRPEDMYRPLNPANYEGSFLETISAAGGGWWGPYIADVTAQDIHLAHESRVLIPMTKPSNGHCCLTQTK